MKKLIIFALIVSIFSCSKEKKENQSVLNGKWYAMAYDPGLTPTPPPPLKKGDIIWTFDFDVFRDKVKMDNNIGNADFLSSNSYKMKLRSNIIRIYTDKKSFVEYEYSVREGVLYLVKIPNGCGGSISFVKD